MAQQKRINRTSRDVKRSEVNLVSARSAMSDDSGSYSRAVRGRGYAKQRSKREFRRRVLTGITVGLVAVLLAGTTAAFAAVSYFNKLLSHDQAGNALDIDAIQAVTTDREAPEDPFWILLTATDYDESFTGTYRTDVMILAYINPAKKIAALVSIPRDTKIYLEDYGTIKINAAYTYGCIEADMGYDNSGPAMAIQAVCDLTGVEIYGYAQVDFDGLIGVIDALGGVTVDVPLDIIGDINAGYVDVYAGEQVLDGEHALVFARSRQYDIGDFQRQANQRVLLQALAKKILSEDPLTIINTVTSIAQMTTTSMTVDEIASIAVSLRGMQEKDIYTYSLISSVGYLDDISYVFVDEYATRELIASINAGIFPDYSEEYYQGETSEIYQAQERATDHLANTIPTIDTWEYLVAVRNGGGETGAATAISDMLAVAGYQQGEIGNANAMVYPDTLIIYRDDVDRVAAEDISRRLGYGRVIPSLSRYSFEGNILVVVGRDYADHR